VTNISQKAVYLKFSKVDIHLKWMLFSHFNLGCRKSDLRYRLVSNMMKCVVSPEKDIGYFDNFFSR
jgi:hypothetical protein